MFRLTKETRDGHPVWEKNRANCWRVWSKVLVHTRHVHTAAHRNRALEAMISSFCYDFGCVCSFMFICTHHVVDKLEAGLSVFFHHVCMRSSFFFCSRSRARSLQVVMFVSLRVGHIHLAFFFVLFLSLSPLCLLPPQVACGFAYTAAVTASGELYTWGAGENGRLGLGDVEDRHRPSRYRSCRVM